MAAVLSAEGEQIKSLIRPPLMGVNVRSQALVPEGLMKVARHGMPGKIGKNYPSRRERCDPRLQDLLAD
jgi:hypothetical protein